LNRRFTEALADDIKEGVMIDASFIEVPRSRPKDKERKAAEVQSVPPLTQRERQLDFDAKWRSTVDRTSATRTM